MVREWLGPINSLNDAFRARRHLWVLCKECGHTALMDPRNLIGKLGELTLEEARRKLRCARCGTARAHFVPRDEPWSSMR
jgi:DNA-directed RNA polymerase subunit RPC12/RpoP